MKGNAKLTRSNIGIQTSNGSGVGEEVSIAMNDNAEISNMTRFAVYIRENSIFTMNDNTVIQNNGEGGVIATGVFNMNGGKIINNTANSSNSGGGVTVRGTFNMNGGEISSNSTSGNGGGVYMQGTFVMNGGEISNNTATNGGGINTFGSSFTMNGGVITNNTATNNGGGVNIEGGTFIIDSEQVRTGISNNSAQNGSQVYKGNPYSTFTVGGEPADSF